VHFLLLNSNHIVHEISKRKATWIGHILCRNCHLQQVTERKIKGGVEVTGRQGRRCRKLLDDLKERRGYSYLKEEALDRTMWRARFGRGFGPVVRQTAKWMNVYVHKTVVVCFHYSVVVVWWVYISLCTAALKGLIVPAPDDRYIQSISGKTTGTENKVIQWKTCLSVTLFITHPTWIKMGLNPGLCSEKQASMATLYDVIRSFKGK
jgi:hypothetical protein